MEERKGTYWAQKFWGDLRKLDPANVCRRGKVEYDDSGFYRIPSLGKEFRIYPKDERFDGEDLLLASNNEFQLLLVSYLLNAQNIDPSGSWVSEKDIKGGSLFFRGPHGMPSAPLEKRFGSDPEGFMARGRAFGGEPVNFGDAAMSFPVLPRISFAVVLWKGDEEFPARITFLMDSSVEAHLPLDVISAMVQSVTQRLLAEDYG